MTGTEIVTVGADPRAHPLHYLTQIHARTGDGLLFTLKRDPDPAPFWLLYPLTAELPQASMPYAAELGEGRGPGWTVRGKDAGAVEVESHDVLLAAMTWTTSLFMPARESGAPLAAADLGNLRSVHAHGETGALLFELENLLEAGPPLWALRVHGPTHSGPPVATVAYTPGPDESGGWQARGAYAQSRIRARDLMTAATAWTMAHHGPPAGAMR